MIEVGSIKNYKYVYIVVRSSLTNSRPQNDHFELPIGISVKCSALNDDERTTTLNNIIYSTAHENLHCNIFYQNKIDSSFRKYQKQVTLSGFLIRSYQHFTIFEINHSLETSLRIFQALSN